MKLYIGLQAREGICGGPIPNAKYSQGLLEDGAQFGVCFHHHAL